jgi:hypothetical protein
MRRITGGDSGKKGGVRERDERKERRKGKMEIRLKK